MTEARPPWEITLDGRSVPAQPGQSVGTALTDAGIRSWRSTRKEHQPRGLFCGIGVCYDCLLTVDGQPNQRACVTPVRPGVRLETAAPAAVSAPTGHRRRGSVDRADVAVVGAGPGGLASAVTAAEAGLRVTMVDAGTQLGGQYWRHPTEAARITDDGASHHDWETFVALRERFFQQCSKGLIRHLPSTQVWFVERPEQPGGDHVLRLSSVSHADAARELDVSELRARSLVLCPGGYDRQLPVPGWELPGVMAAGGVQALLKGYGSLAGKRAVVAGTGPFLLPVATGLAEAGSSVAAVCEAGNLTGWLRGAVGAVQVPSKAIEGAAYARTLLRHRIPYRIRTAVTGIHGDAQVEAVTLSRLDSSGRVIAGSQQRIAVDLVALGWGFTPSLELVVAAGGQTRIDVDQSLVAVVDDDQRSTAPNVYVAGEATGVGGAMLALAEGELAALAVTADQGTPIDGRRRRRLQRKIRRAWAFAEAMHAAHPVPRDWHRWLTADTTICRCEEVSYGDILTARDELGAVNAKTVKLLARPGMGWCQGRVCGFATAKLAAAGSGRDLTAEDLRPTAKRPLSAPVTLGELANLTGPETR